MRVDADTAADALSLEPRTASDRKQRDRCSVGVLRFDAEQQFEVDVSSRRNGIHHERRPHVHFHAGFVVRGDFHRPFPEIGEVH